MIAVLPAGRRTPAVGVTALSARAGLEIPARNATAVVFGRIVFSARCPRGPHRRRGRPRSPNSEVGVSRGYWTSVQNPREVVHHLHRLALPWCDSSRRGRRGGKWWLYCDTGLTLFVSGWFNFACADGSAIAEDVQCLGRPPAQEVMKVPVVVV
jgi:hypothetical protein